MSSNSSMNQDKKVKNGKEKKVKVSFKRIIRLVFLPCLPIYQGLAPAQSCADLHKCNTRRVLLY